MSEIFTEKQERNGVAAASEVATQNSATPSADITGDVSGLIGSAESNAHAFMEEGHAIMVDGPGGLGGSAVQTDWSANIAMGEDPPAGPFADSSSPSSTTGVGDGKTALPAGSMNDPPGPYSNASSPSSTSGLGDSKSEASVTMPPSDL